MEIVSLKRMAAILDRSCISVWTFFEFSADATKNTLYLFFQLIDFIFDKTFGTALRHFLYAVDGKISPSWKNFFFWNDINVVFQLK